MKRPHVLQLLHMILLLPLFPVVGIPAGGADPGKRDEDPPPASDDAADGKPGDGKPGDGKEGDPPSDDGGDGNGDPPAEETDPPAADVDAPADEGEAALSTDELQQELLMAQAMLDGIRAGISADAVEDAVVLAMHDLAKAGAQPSKEALASALAEVVKRRPDMSAAAVPPAPPKGGAADPPGDAEPAEKRYLDKKYGDNPYYRG